MPTKMLNKKLYADHSIEKNLRSCDTRNLTDQNPKPSKGDSPWKAERKKGNEPEHCKEANQIKVPQAALLGLKRAPLRPRSSRKPLPFGKNMWCGRKRAHWQNLRKRCCDEARRMGTTSLSQRLWQLWWQAHRLASRPARAVMCQPHVTVSFISTGRPTKPNLCTQAIKNLLHSSGLPCWPPGMDPKRDESKLAGLRWLCWGWHWSWIVGLV